MPLSSALDFPFFTKFEDEFRVSGLLQLVILLLGAITADEVSQAFLLANLTYWSLAAVIMLRRNGNATRGDRFFLKWGYPLMLPLIAFLLAILPHGLLRH